MNAAQKHVHEVLDDTVELGALVAHTLLKRGAVLAETGGESTEVLNGLGDGLEISTEVPSTATRT